MADEAVARRVTVTFLAAANKLTLWPISPQPQLAITTCSSFRRRISAVIVPAVVTVIPACHHCLGSFLDCQASSRRWGGSKCQQSTFDMCSQTLSAGSLDHCLDLLRRVARLVRLEVESEPTASHTGQPALPGRVQSRPTNPVLSH